MKFITKKMVDDYEQFLTGEEKSKTTIQKYTHDVFAFNNWLNGQEVTKNKALEYKSHITGKCAVASVNSIISSLNSFFSFMEWSDMKIKTIKTQRSIFSSDETELTKAEYSRLLTAAQSKNNQRLYLLMQCMCATGIRVSEVKYITVESLSFGRAEIDNKGKRRIVFIPTKLCKALKSYAKSRKIKSGAVFVSKNGRPLDRSNIWASMKKLCDTAKVSAK